MSFHEKLLSDLWRMHQAILFLPQCIRWQLRLILNQQAHACCLQFEYHHLHTSISLYKETSLPPGEKKWWSYKNVASKRKQSFKHLYYWRNRNNRLWGGSKKKFSILFKSVSAGVTMVKKNEAWATITETVTIVSSETQTVAQVKKKWFNIKANSKQTQLEYKGHLMCQT